MGNYKTPPLGSIATIGTLKKRFQSVLKEVEGLKAVVVVGGDKKNIANSAAHSDDVGPHSLQLQRIQDVVQLRDEVRPVLAAKRGLEEETSVVRFLAGEHADLVALGREGFQLRNVCGLMLQLFYSLYHFCQKRCLVGLIKFAPIMPLLVSLNSTTLYYKLIFTLPWNYMEEESEAYQDES